MPSKSRVTHRVKSLSSVLANRVTRNPWQGQMDRVLENMIINETVGREQTASSIGLVESANSLADRVRSEGVILFPGAITGELLDHLREEFRHMIDNSHTSPYHVENHESSTHVLVDPASSLDKHCYPVTAAFFSSRVCREIARCFYRSEAEGFNFNYSFYAHETTETATPLSGQLHWDRTQTLKFWIYIDDITNADGPMRIHPGSTSANKAERTKKRQTMNRLEGGKDNVVSAPPEELKFLEGPAGTVLLHDSDCSHGASPVLGGRVRRIMRSNCRSAKPSKSVMLKRLLFNPQNFYRC